MTTALSWILKERALTAAAGFLLLLLGIAAVRGIRKVVRSPRPDKLMSRALTMITLLWSGEATWELGTQVLHLPWWVVLPLLLVLEVNLAIAMVRAELHLREHGHPGHYVRTAWIVAVVMGAVGAGISGSLTEALLRLAVPLLAVNTWADGVRPAPGVRTMSGSVTWRWTPRRFLLALGVIEPGERDVNTVHRERLTQQMTRLHYLTEHGMAVLHARRCGRLARLTLAADDAMVADVRARVARTRWVTDPGQPGIASEPFVIRFDHERPIGPDRGPEPVREPVRASFDYARPIGPMPAKRAQAKRVKPRSLTAQERVLAAHKATPKATHEQLAEQLGVSVSTVKRHRPSGSSSGSSPARTRRSARTPELVDASV
ncbi:hypothetical protein [Actinoplanes sp. NPDC051494]|uniref:hypothetical protein n=1 Tax=Actinoplanes sp. NPDC051494 TaxID=3363907 RepID=UPI003796567D